MDPPQLRDAEWKTGCDRSGRRSCSAPPKRAGRLARGDVAGYNSAVSRAGSSVRIDWRLQIQAACQKLGVPFPAWAKIIGTQPIPEN